MDIDNVEFVISGPAVRLRSSAPFLLVVDARFVKEGSEIGVDEDHGSGSVQTWRSVA